MGESYTDYLYPAPDVAFSAGQIFDLLATPQRYNTSPTAEAADVLALTRDWAAVGEDLRQAILRFALMHQ